MAPTKNSEQNARRLSTVRWVLVLATVGLIFDGCDLVVYGAGVSTFLRDASQIGTVTPPIAGALASFLISAGLSMDLIFYVLAGLALLGVCLPLLVPPSRDGAVHGLARA